MAMGCSIQLCYADTISPPEEEFLFQGVSLFGEENKQLDISQFQDQYHIEAGQYLWNATVNQKEYPQQLFELKIHPESQKPELCLGQLQLQQLGIRTDTLIFNDAGDCLFSREISPYFSYEILQQALKVNLTVPTVMLINPNLEKQHIQQGANSFFTNVSYNYSRSEQLQYDNVNEQHFVGLQSGLNLYGWYLRHQGVFSLQNHVSEYESGTYTVYRDLLAQKARMSLGHLTMSGSNSVPVFGMMLESDPMMRPETERYYSPIIENIAQTHALVKVFQNERLVVEKSVTPGPFRIDQLRGLNRQGDLLVEIHETNQNVRRFVVPYAMQLNLLRQKQLNYRVALGNFIDQIEHTSVPVFQSEMEYGYRHNMSLSSGLSYAEGYLGATWGAIYNYLIGGFAFKLDYAQAEQLSQQGYKFQVNYQTQPAQWGSSINLSAAQHSPEFPVFSTALQARVVTKEDDRTPAQSLKQDVRVSLNQSLTEGRGTLALSGLWQNYWNSSNQSQQLQLSYAKAWRKVQYSLSYSQSKTSAQLADRNLFLSLSLPVGSAKVSANIQQQTYTQKSLKSTMNLNNRLGDSGLWNYTLNAGYSEVDEMVSSNLGTSLSFSGSKVQANMAYSQSDADRQISFSSGGAMVIHRYGVTLGKPVGETFAIGHIETNNDLKSTKKWGEGYDRWGNTIYSNLNPYTSNHINFNPTMLPLSVHLDVLEYEYYPRRYSSALVVFKAEQRENMVLMLESDSKLDIPLGATIETEHGETFGLAGQANQVFLQNRKFLKQGVRLCWGSLAHQQCVLDAIQVDNSADDAPLKMIEARCQS